MQASWCHHLSVDLPLPGFEAQTGKPASSGFEAETTKWSRACTTTSPQCRRVSHLSMNGWSPSAHTPTLTWSYRDLDFGQHSLHHHPRMYTCFSMCPSARCPRWILRSLVRAFASVLHRSRSIVHGLHARPSLLPSTVSHSTPAHHKPMTCCRHSCLS
jgi:hypothetical protein